MSNLGLPEMAVLLVLALFVFGPERLPKVAADAGRLVRQLRQMAQGVRDDLQAELGPEVGNLDLASLHPKTFLARNLFGDEEDGPGPAAPSARPAGPRLADGELPPYDEDAT